MELGSKSGSAILPPFLKPHPHPYLTLKISRPTSLFVILWVLELNSCSHAGRSLVIRVGCSPYKKREQQMVYVGEDVAALGVCLGNCGPRCPVAEPLQQKPR